MGVRNETLGMFEVSSFDGFNMPFVLRFIFGGARFLQAMFYILRVCFFEILFLF